jgi:hypothetical protein
MLTSPTTLRDRLVAFDHTIGLLPGRRVALLGFRDPNVNRVEENIRTLRTTPAWSVLDLRTNSSEPLHELLDEALGAPKLALLVDSAASLPADVELLIRALHDKRDTVQWMSGKETSIPAEQILYIIASGVRQVDELSHWLARIDFMDFIRPPEG